MAAEILADHAERISGLNIVPSSGGRFVVQVGDNEIFDKKDAGRFPQPGEATRLVAQAL